VKAEGVVTRKSENVGREIVKDRKEKMGGKGEDKVKRREGNIDWKSQESKDKRKVLKEKIG
jgi:hypothetical protein